MAKMEYSGFDAVDGQIATLERDTIKRLVYAGAEALVKGMQDTTGQYHHVVTGSMRANVKPGKLHEDLNSAWIEVYPQGEDSRGVSNAKKAFVINYGYGGRKTAKTGDKFITGNKARFEIVINQAMQTENQAILQEIANGGK